MTMKFRGKLLKPFPTPVVETRVLSLPSPGDVVRYLLLFACFAGVVLPRVIAEEPLTPPPVEAIATHAAVGDSDELIYNDGDRVRGRLESRENGEFVFRSPRFGLLRVSEKEATVVLAHPQDAAAAAVADASSTQEPHARTGVLWYLSPLELQRRLREVFGQWNGRFQLSTELAENTVDRSSLAVEGQLMRKWTRDDLQINARYDYSESDDIKTTDMVKAGAAWRHDFTTRYFSIYRPALEWNKAFYEEGYAGLGSYVLFQQEIGAGVNVSQRPDRQLRLGISENLFQVWQTHPRERQEFRAYESAFFETEWLLPWRISLKDRVVLYYSFERSEFQGWENRFEIDKKLTEALSIGLRHEVRESDDLQVQDYTLLRFFLGLDF